MTYTKAQRKAIAAAFRAAKPHLWDGRKVLGRPTICGALYDTHLANWSLARDVVMDRLHPNATVWNWLHERANVPVRRLTDRRVQQHRHAWLDKLIEEFSA